jgi:hypothetical protein
VFVYQQDLTCTKKNEIKEEEYRFKTNHPTYREEKKEEERHSLTTQKKNNENTKRSIFFCFLK